MNSVQENATAFVQFLYGGAHLSSEEFCIETTSLHHLELEIGHRVFVEESCGPMKNSKKTHTKRSIVVEIVERLREQTFRVRSIDSLHRRGNKSENLGLVTAGMMFLDHELIESNLRGRLSKGRLHDYALTSAQMTNML